MIHRFCIAILLITLFSLHAFASEDGGVMVLTVENPNKHLTVTVPIGDQSIPTPAPKKNAKPNTVENVIKIKVVGELDDEDEEDLRNNEELEANIHSILDENQQKNKENEEGEEYEEDDVNVEETDETDEYIENGEVEKEGNDEIDSESENVDEQDVPEVNNNVEAEAVNENNNVDDSKEKEEQSKSNTKKSENNDKDESDEQEVIDEQELDENEESMKGSIKAAAASSPLVTGCRTQGQIAITYNEGPSDATAQILRQYAKADARATFFVNASWLYTQQYAMVVKNIYNAGHFIGMTYRVKETDPAKYSEDDVRADVIKMAGTIESIIKISPKYVRLYATKEKDFKTEKILRELGFVIVGYNLDSQDYSKLDATGPNSIQEVYSKAFKNYKEQYDTKGAFISNNYDLPFTGSLVAVPNVINTINKEGYTMVRLDGCLDDTKPYKKTANSTEYVNDKFSFGQPEYHSGQKRELLDSVVILDKPGSGGKVAGSTGVQGVESKGNIQKASISLCLLAVISAIFF